MLSRLWPISFYIRKNSKILFNAIDPQHAIPATIVTTEGGLSVYHYADLESDLYHCVASLEGYKAVCQNLNYTAEKAAAGMAVDMKLDPLAGNGYETGYVMLQAQEFIDTQMTSQKDTWGSEYVHLFNTPRFLRPEGRPGRHQQTTNEELADFIAKLAKIATTCMYSVWADHQSTAMRIFQKL